MNKTATKKILEMLCQIAQKNLETLDMPNEFRYGERIDIEHGRKTKLNLLEHIPQYFKDNQYEVKVSKKLGITFEKVKDFDISTSIQITFYEPCWRFEYLYIIQNEKEIGSAVSFSFASEDNIDVQGAFENIVFATQYLENQVEKRFIAKCLLKDDSDTSKDTDILIAAFEINTLERLCHTFEKDIQRLPLPHNFPSIHDVCIDFNNRFYLELSSFFPQYFIENHFDVKRFDNLTVRLRKAKAFGIDISIQIGLTSDGGIFSYTYFIRYKHLCSIVDYRCVCENEEDVQKAFENAVFITQYLAEYVEKAFIETCITGGC
ncbi:MAG: hypothetical protein FWH04_03980 [Oscillospiraceae bacterium]|nr:hypothetical protein [Oscillospiraceae bacterium]